MDITKDHADIVRLYSKRFRFLVRTEWGILQCAVMAAVLIAPVALVWADGYLRIVGLVYAGFYTALMLVPTAINVLVSYDCLRMLFKKSPVVLPVFLKVAYMAAPRRAEPPFLARLTTMGSPLFMVSVALASVVSQLRRAEYMALHQTAKLIRDELMKSGAPAPEPSVVTDELREWERQTKRQTLRSSELVGANA